MSKQTEHFFTPLTEADWAAMRLTDGDLDRLLQPCELMPYVATVGAPDQPTIDDASTVRPTARKAGQTALDGGRGKSQDDAPA